MFKFKVADVKGLRDYITAIAVLVSEATFKIEQDGLKLREMDPSRVAMVDFAVPASFFVEYVVTEKAELCVAVTELLKLLKRAGKDEAVEMFLDDATQKLQVTITGKHSRSFTMPTLETTEPEMPVPVPKVPYNARAKVTTSSLTQIVDDAALVSDHVKAEADQEKVTLTAAGDLMGATITLQKGSDALLDLEVKEASKATFSLSYLTDIVKAAAVTSEIATLEFSTDMPLKINFEQKTADSKLTFFLAPRIETD